ncbi:MAG: HU family DNA-binding protein [Polyangiaceae bacterium]
MAASNKLTKAQFIAALAESAGLDKKSAASVLESILEIVKKQLGDGGPGEVTIPGLVKLKAKSTPATQDREGINPFTKEKTIIKGKPASKKIRASAVKPLKE